MPIKLELGFSKKIGQPDYGSLIASYHVVPKYAVAMTLASLRQSQKTVG